MLPAKPLSRPDVRSARRIDLDWLRVLAVLLLVPFHSALIFVQNPNSIMYVKDTANAPFLDHTAGWIHQFHMPLLFWISGAAAYFGLSRRNAAQFARERSTRLFLPALFGMLAFIPPMTYITQLWRGQDLTFWEHFRRYWTIGPDLSGVLGTWTPAHLWFLIYLYVFSILALPVFLFMRRDASAEVAGKMARFFERPGAILLLAVPMALASSVNILGDKNPIYYFLMFLAGYLMMTGIEYQRATYRIFPVALVLGIAFQAMIKLWRPGFAEWSLPWVFYGFMLVLNRWLWVLVWLGLGARLLTRTTSVLAYLAETSFAFYVLHLPINTLVAWGMIRLVIPVGPKYLLIVAVTTICTFILVEGLRHIPWVSTIYGLKKRIAIPDTRQSPS